MNIKVWGLAISVCRLFQTDLGMAEDYCVEGESQHLLNIRCSSHFTDLPCPWSVNADDCMLGPL